MDLWFIQMLLEKKLLKQIMEITIKHWMSIQMEIHYQVNCQLVQVIFNIVY